MHTSPDVAAHSVSPPEAVAAESAGRIEHDKAGPVTIIGCGNAASALACYLSNQGITVRLLVRSRNKVSGLSERNSFTATGKLEGQFAIEFVTEEPAEALAGSETVIIATVTTAYPEIATRLAPHLRSGQEVILFSSKFGGVIEFSTILNEEGAKDVTLLETDSLFASRVQENGQVWVRGIKQWTYFSARNRTLTLEHSAVIKRYFPLLEPAENVVQRGLTDFGALAHALTMIANMNRVDSGSPFLFYHEGFTERTVTLMERMEEEFRSVAHAYGTTLIPMPELLNRYYGCDTSSLLKAMQTVPNYRFSQAPDTLNHRFIEEDVSCSLVPIQELARKAGLKTPLIDSVINISSALLGVDFSATGRNLYRLGWDQLTHEEILGVINA